MAMINLTIEQISKWQTSFESAFAGHTDEEIRNSLKQLSQNPSFNWALTDKNNATLLIWAVKTGHTNIAIDIANSITYVLIFAMSDNNNKTAHDYLSQIKPQDIKQLKSFEQLKKILDSKETALSNFGKTFKTLLNQTTLFLLLNTAKASKAPAIKDQIMRQFESELKNAVAHDSTVCTTPAINNKILLFEFIKLLGKDADKYLIKNTNGNYEWTELAKMFGCEKPNITYPSTKKNIYGCSLYEMAQTYHANRTLGLLLNSQRPRPQYLGRRGRQHD
ncbi:MAG: hypothetical protein MJ164_00670 [Alphaproteobacteria bacterium]|nr:hypothetical protein [Alphaproteobacteria bacterium]